MVVTMEGFDMINEKISIVMVNYNKELYLKDAINSVLEQTYKNWELIIIDDGSTDSSKEIIQHYNDPRIHPFFLSENNHICKATNLGLSKATGKYIARLDSDDIWIKDKLEKQLIFFQKNPTYKICFTKLDLINENNEIINEKNTSLYNLYNTRQTDRYDWLRFFFYYGNSLIQSSMIYESELLKEVGMFRLSYVQSHDLDFFIRLAKRYEFGFIEEPLLLYRRTHDQNSASHDFLNIRFFNEHMLIRKHFFDEMSDPLFIKTFGQNFINPSASTPEALEIEKAFLLLNCVNNTTFNPILGLTALDELLEQKTYETILKDDYNFTPKSFYKENLKNQYFTKDTLELIRKLEIEIEHQKNENIQLKKENSSYANDAINRNEHIAYLEGSISWKITKPLRKGRSLVNKWFKK